MARALRPELPALEVDLLDVLDRGGFWHIDRFGDGATEPRLDRGHHPHVAHGADGPLAHGAVEDLVVLGPQPGCVHDVAVLGDVLGDRLDLLGLVAQVLQRPRHGLVDDLHGTAADELLELDQRQIRLDTSGVTVHHEADGVVAHHAVGHVGHVAGNRQVVCRLNPAVIIACNPLEQVSKCRAESHVHGFLEQPARQHAGHPAGLTQRLHYRGVPGMACRRYVLPYLSRQEQKILLRGRARFKCHQKARLALAYEPYDFAEVQRMVDIA